ncbi:hypothetical protein [Streptomyces hokutonensis]|uniref:hypothetical protein n=1 Tax=Streptomyces hokutonensis TaxID=1306990 RepID=UPI0036865ED9
MIGSSFLQFSETPNDTASFWAELVKATVANHDIGKASPGFQGPDLALVDFGTARFLVEAKAPRAGATWRAQIALGTLSSQLQGLHDHASDPDTELTRRFLRTAEEALGIPSIASGIIQGLEPTPPPVQLWHDYEDRIEVVNGIVYSALGSGKTFAALTTLLHRSGWMNRAERVQTTSLLPHLVNNTEVLREFLQALTQGLLCGGAKLVGCLIAVPPHESSPCGVLRLATPIVPGAPGIRTWPHQSTMTLAV